MPEEVNRVKKDSLINLIDESNYDAFRATFKPNFKEAAKALEDFARVIEKLKEDNLLTEEYSRRLDAAWSVFAWHVDHVYPEFKNDLLN